MTFNMLGNDISMQMMTSFLKKMDTLLVLLEDLVQEI